MSTPTSREDKSIMLEHFIDAFPTLFLPKDLPTMPLAEATNGCKNDRDSVMNCWKDFLANGDYEKSVLSQVASVFVDLHLGGGASSSVCKSLEKTKVGGYWGFHVRAQNAAVLIYRETDEEVQFMAWQVQGSNAEVTGSVALSCTFPQVTVRVRWEKLLFSIETLCDLSRREQSLAVAKTSKAGAVFQETRDVNDPVLVLDVLTAAFGGDFLSSESSECIVLVNKKMNDEVRYESSKRPWRREPVYAALKNILHLICMRENKSDDGAYKILLQRFLMHSLANVSGNKNVSSIGHSSLVEASRKLARRLEKLREESEVRPSVMTKLDKEMGRVAKRALEVVNRDWENMQNAKNSADFNVPLEVMKQATRHTLPKCGKVLSELSRIATEQGGNIAAGEQSAEVGSPEDFFRLRKWSPFKVDDINRQIERLDSALTTQLGNSPQDFVGVIHDVSEGIVDAFADDAEAAINRDDIDSVTVALLKLERRFIKVGLGLGRYKTLSPYQGDVRGSSKVILVAFTICLLVDMLACREHPLLRQHKLGVPTTGIFDELFLSSMKYRKHLSKVESYLKWRDTANGPPTLETTPSEQSFAVKFAARSRPMEETRVEIIETCRLLQIQKHSEKAQKQSDYDWLVESVAHASCSCYYRDRYPYGVATCSTCRTRNEANNITIACHEKYLPEALHHQQAVVFELQIPDALACQRDCIVVFANLVCKVEWQEKSSFRGYWRDDTNLSQWQYPLSTAQVLLLGSTRKKVTRSHYREANVCSRHDFVVDHGYAVTAMGSDGPMVDWRCWEWKMPSHTTMSVQPGPYKSLEPFFSSLSHTENEVIALKSEASEELSLLEFDAVGSLRAGASLQLVRMLAGLQQQAFSLDREEIVSLFCCVLWQVGPKLRSDFFRKSCSVLRLQPEFSTRMCTMLHGVITNCETNWSNQNALVAVVHIGRHLLEHAISSENSDAVLECVKILRECRLVSLSWIAQLLPLLNDCSEDDARQSYRKRLVDISCIGALTYLDCKGLLRKADDVQQWSFLRAVFHDNFVPNEILEPSPRRPLLLHCMEVAEQVAPRLHDLLRTRNGEAGLSKFLNEYWTGSSKGMLRTPWTIIGSSNCFCAHFELTGACTATIQLDIVSGSFLVDGSPCARLPKEICAHPIYRQHFDNALFLVQPIGKNAYRTSCPLNGFHFEFYPSRVSPSLGFGDIPIIIKERITSPTERSLLVPNSVLEGDFPNILQSDYSHWFVLSSGQVGHSNNMYFSPLKYTDPRMNLPLEKHEYILRYSDQILIEQMSGSHFLDINSVSFQQLFHAVFHGLSPVQFVHAKVATSTSQEVVIELPRLDNLSFRYNGESIITQQFGGLEVARDQNAGVLYGLKQGLLLKDPQGLTDNIFLCPHGSVSRFGNEIIIDTKTLRNPPFFKFNLRSELRDLKLSGEGRLGWLFLALLHAHTSHLKPDAFTGCTGTQRALDILRLGCCRGNLITSTDEDRLESLGPELQLIRSVAELSQRREDYHGMEKVCVSAHPALCAHEGFALLARQQLRSLVRALRAIGKEHLIQSTDTYQKVLESFEGRVGDLPEKAYFQRRKHYPTDCQLTKEEEALLSVEQAPASLSADSFDRIDRKSIMRVGFAAQKRGTLPFQQPSLLELLCNNVKLAGIRCDDNVAIGNAVLFFNNLIKSRKEGGFGENGDVAFHDIWLHLYQMARESQGTNPGRVQFGFLLTFVAAHYSGMHDYLHQLVLVALYPHLFPRPPEHSTYAMTREVDFVQSHVDDLIEEHLDKFSTPKPCSWCPEDIERWQIERNQHKMVNGTTRAQLTYRIWESFRLGGYVRQIDVSLSHVRDKPRFETELRDLFDRWRHSKELKSFSVVVSKKLEELLLLISPVAPPRGLVPQTRQWPWRASFELRTHSITALSIEPELQQLLRSMSASGRCEDAFEFTPPGHGGRRQASPFSFLHADMHSSEMVLCKRLAEELQESVKGALVSPEQTYAFLNDSGVVDQIYLDLLAYRKRAKCTLTTIWDFITSTRESRSSLLPFVGLWNSIAPWNVLADHFKPCNLIALKSALNASVPELHSIHFTNAFAVAVKHVQRSRRCLAFLRKGMTAYPQLTHDIVSQGCVGWSPNEYPEFLAFEIDNGICIRKQQAQVAKEILRNDRGNRLLQMNMGEGKSSVIMPLVLCIAADGNSIARGTVLSSLYSTNAADWQGKVGGLLARQLFPMICCRDMALDARQADKMRKRLIAIREGRHVIVTVPEHRLSLENKALEACSKGDFELGRTLLDVLHELGLNARDFVDESDEIASPKYQLVYPLGAPQDMDGAHIRWLVHAAAIQSVSRHAMYLFETYGPATVEIVGMTPNDHEYCAIRLLGGSDLRDAYSELCNLIVEDILKGIVPWQNGLNLRMNPHEKKMWKRCVLGEKITHGDLASIESEKVQFSALCLRGMLSHDILLLVLQKRFRVEYGSHPFREHYQMAVPYRAKDVAAERTDFAHPDVCLGLTFATYYQSGLSHSQLMDVFERLSRMSDAAAQYSSWTAGLSEIGNLKCYSAVNLADQMLFKKKIYPKFRKHLGVIDFWLLKVIFPAQAKQYEAKLTSTAVDLFKSRKLFPSCAAITTGFSGTDDLCLVLPPTVQQENLPDLAKTNGVQILNILRPENNTYYPLAMQGLNGKVKGGIRTTVDQILQLLQETESKTDVVLDAGALVLHMSNEEFSRAWLKQRGDCDACVFFRKDRIVFVSKHDETRVMPFSGSHFEADMSRCLLYLDDEHTRGSDFKLPLNARALVTLGKGMNKDKVVQACMRMRQIGKGQQLAFVASHDVHLELERTPNDTRSDVSRLSCIINWALQNTARRICDLVPYFVSQAVCSMRKSQALQRDYYKSGTAPAANDDDLVELANACREKDEMKLKDMYIQPRGEKTLFDLTSDRLGDLKRSELGRTILDQVRSIAPAAKRHCSLHDEEQEVEREQEVDEERQVERPPSAQHSESFVSPELSKYFGQCHASIPIQIAGGAHQYFADALGFHPLSDYFSDTQFAPDIGEQLNRSNVFVTSDFMKSVKGDVDKTFYLKPFRWIMRPACTGVNVAIVISNYEAEALFLPQLRAGSCPIEWFVPIVTRDQLHLDHTPPEALPAELHVFGASINANGEVLDGMKSYLGLHPDPTSEWNRLYEQGELEVDGFVPPNNRRGGHCPFRKSPIPFLVRFWADARHLGSDMRTSVLGQMIELSEQDLETDYRMYEG